MTLEEYVAAIERHMTQRRGVEHTLTPRDFAQARSWFEASVPLALVLLGADGAIDLDPTISSLAYCRRRIDALAAQVPAGGEHRAAGSLPNLAEALNLLRERLFELPTPVRRRFAMALVRLTEVDDLVSVSTRPNWDYLRQRVRSVDEEVAAAAVTALPQDAADALAAELDSARARLRGEMDPIAVDAAVQRLAATRAREFLRLPRLSEDD